MIRAQLYAQKSSMSSATTVSSGSLSSEEEQFFNSDNRNDLESKQHRRPTIVNAHEETKSNSSNYAAAREEEEHVDEEIKQLRYDKDRLCQENQRLQKQLDHLEDALNVLQKEIDSKSQELNFKSTKLSLMQMENDYLLAAQEQDSFTLRDAQKSTIELEHQIREQEDELNNLRHLIEQTENLVEIFRQELNRESDSLEQVSQERDGLQIQVNELAVELSQRNDSFDKLRHLVNIYDEELNLRRDFTFGLHELASLKQCNNVTDDVTSCVRTQQDSQHTVNGSLQFELMAQVKSSDDLPSPFCGRQEQINADPIFTFQSSAKDEEIDKGTDTCNSCTCSRSSSSSCSSFSSTCSSSERESTSSSESFNKVSKISSPQHKSALHQKLAEVRLLLASDVAPEILAALRALELGINDTLNQHWLEAQQFHHVMTECARLQQRNNELVHNLRETSFVLETNIQNKITECQVKLKIELDSMHQVELELAEARCQIRDQQQTISDLRVLTTKPMTSQSVQSQVTMYSRATQTEQISLQHPHSDQMSYINTSIVEARPLHLIANKEGDVEHTTENNFTGEAIYSIPNIHIEAEHPLISSQLLVALDLAVTQVEADSSLNLHDIGREKENTLLSAPARIVRHLSVPRCFNVPLVCQAKDQRSASICGTQKSPLLVKRTLYKLYKSSELQTEFVANKRRAESFSAPSGCGALNFVIPRKYSSSSGHSDNCGSPTIAKNSNSLSLKLLEKFNASAPKFIKQSRINCYQDYNFSSTDLPYQKSSVDLVKNLLPAEHLAIADLDPEAEEQLSESDRLLNIELLKQAAKASVSATRPRAHSALNYSSAQNSTKLVRKKTTSLSAISDILYSKSLSNDANDLSATWPEEKESEEYNDLPVFVNDCNDLGRYRSTEQDSDFTLKISTDRRVHHSRRPATLPIVSEASVDFEDRRLSVQKDLSNINLKKEAFPSLPNKVLQAMNLLTKTEDEDVESENNEDKLEEQFVRLSLAFRTDRQTLNDRIALHLRARNQAENNAITELRKIKDYMRALSRNGLLINLLFNNNNNIVNNQIDLENDTGVNSPNELLSHIQGGLEVLEACIQRLAADCEILGAVQQEGRLSKAVDVMLQFVEILRHKISNEENELEDTRAMVAATSGSNHNLASIGVSSIDFGLENMTKRSMSMAGGAGAKSVHISSLGYAIRRPQSLTSEIQNRRSNVALLSSRSAGSAPASVPSQGGFRVLRRSSATTNDNLISGDTVQSRMRNLVNFTSVKKTNLDNRSAHQVHERTKIDSESFNKAMDQLPVPLSVGNTSVNDSQEIVFQHGFEQGTRIRMGREMSDLRNNQVQLVERLESLQDRYQFSEEEEAQMDCATSAKESWLEKTICRLTDIAQWDQLGAHFRWFFCLAALFTAFGMLIWAVLRPRYSNLNPNV